ncbi:YggT family protein [Methylobacterium sp. E-041]|jgi:YggT family protein|uniref:YggT family protein n=1 Tax=Methylobacterium cerastii TaxID=932741 RepID=A0ABQ4QEY8_9HYPH|nr:MULTISPECIES: YggT family protein [Methylobacterium]RZK98372.1 MAG: YggT family protein [Methylobacterium sp.]TXM91204.1 YggT family protein [Methylobacterium sp. WL122]MCJ2007219.1 YggT family protein [Methylobacterium sp. J-092]MCJ2039819.1 YggT family protein [Methylobacterium sp. J-059]MCJ2079554.1 YggT family protein [Methylobacterium sp. E-016]
MNSLIWLFDTVVQLFIYVLIASAILSWLVAFNVVNVRNPIVSQIGEVLYRITEPVLRPIRNLLPNLGGVDISPIILILLLLFVSRLLHEFVPADPYVYAR